MTASLSKPENELTVAMKESHRTSRWSPWRNGSLNSLRGFRKTSCSSGARPYELRIKTDQVVRTEPVEIPSSCNLACAPPIHHDHGNLIHARRLGIQNSSLAAEVRAAGAEPYVLYKDLSGRNGMVVRTWTGPRQPCSPPGFGVWAHLAKSFQPGV